MGWAILTLVVVIFLAIIWPKFRYFVSVPGHGDPPFREHDDPPFQLMATHPTGVATQPVEGVSGTVG